MARKTKNPSGGWTKKELGEFIREKTSKVRRIIENYGNRIIQGLKHDTKFEKQIEKVVESSGGRRGKLVLKLTKSKEDLLNQARQLQSFERYSEKTEFADEFEKEKMERAYKSFTDTYGDMGREEYVRLVNTLGQIDKTAWGYEDTEVGNALIGNIQDYISEGFTSEEILEAMRTVENNIEPGMTGMDMIEELDEEITNLRIYKESFEE